MYPNLTKTQVDKFEKDLEYSKYEIQKDTKIQMEIISHSKVVDGSHDRRGGKAECLRTLLLKRVVCISLYNKGHSYIRNRRPDVKESGRKFESDTSISVNAMSFNR